MIEHDLAPKCDAPRVNAVRLYDAPTSAAQTDGADVVVDEDQ